MKKRIIKVQGKWYVLLYLWGGKAYLSKLYDICNEKERSGIIWYMQPFYYEHEVWYTPLFKIWISGVRFLINQFKSIIPIKYYVSKDYFEYCEANFITPSKFHRPVNKTIKR